MGQPGSPSQVHALSCQFVYAATDNLIDLVRFGAVVDFVNANELMFPWVFNVADAAISVGAVLLFADQFLLSGRKQAKKQS